MRTRSKNSINIKQTTPIARVAKAVASKKQNLVTTTPKKPISRYQSGLLNLTRTRKYLLDKYEGLPLYIQGLTRYQVSTQCHHIAALASACGNPRTNLELGYAVRSCPS
jgi:hypothetical protein